VITNRNQKSTSWTRHSIPFSALGPAKCAKAPRTPQSPRKAAPGLGQNGTSRARALLARVRGGATDEPPLLLPRIGSCSRVWGGHGGSGHAKNHEIFALSVPWELKREDWSLLFHGCLLPQWLESGWKELGLQCTERWRQGAVSAGPPSRKVKAASPQLAVPDRYLSILNSWLPSPSFGAGLPQLSSETRTRQVTWLSRVPLCAAARANPSQRSCAIPPPTARCPVSLLIVPLIPPSFLLLLSPCNSVFSSKPRSK
jgi:hypothetical protein